MLLLLRLRYQSCRGIKTLLDIGDIVGVEGGIRRTDKGELSVVAETFKVVYDLSQLSCICSLFVELASMLCIHVNAGAVSGVETP